MIDARRRAATLTLVGLVAGAVVLPLAPLDLATMRLGPLSLTWWYAAATPVVAALVAVAALVLHRE
ncbi:MAG: hypothetical protein HYU41_19600 [Candidatus Rokubacteria bacterium]|nr:hypothetical protein [Candidatus Rokubacteria bacterium]